MEHLPIAPAFEKNDLAITMQTSNFFAPYASVTALSIIEHASPAYNYDIIFMTWDMQEETERKLISMAEGRPNVSVRVVDLAREIKQLSTKMKKRKDFGKFSNTGVVRLLLPDLLSQFEIVLNLDCDMLVCADVAELFRQDMSEYYIGGVVDLICYIYNSRPGEQQFSDDLIFNRLKLNEVSDYLNAGLFLLNLNRIRSDFQQKRILDYATAEGICNECYEQDAFNGLFNAGKKRISQDWNWFNDLFRIVRANINYLPVNDGFLKAYRQTETHVKNIHYVGNVKPWATNLSYPHAKDWWATAIKSPFLQSILERATKKNIDRGSEEIKCKNPRLLFYCATGYQLLNVLNIRLHYYNGIQADVIIPSESEASRYANALKCADVFTCVLKIPSGMRYTDCFVPDAEEDGVRAIFDQLGDSKKVTVHLYEGGGCGAYTQDLSKQGMSFGAGVLKRVKDIYMYAVEAHCGAGNPFPLIPIPMIDEKDSRFTAVLRSVFGECCLPKEKYIFLQECFHEEKCACDDSALLNTVAEIVGKENIAVRLHPRASAVNEKLYRLHGYRTYPGNKTPWEMALLAPGLENKVLLSVSSTALVSPFLAGESAVQVISLFDLMPLSKRVKSSAGAYRGFLNKLREEANRERTTMFCPESMAELRADLRYIKGCSDTESGTSQ